jgi:hypothetical protein
VLKRESCMYTQILNGLREMPTFVVPDP